MSLQVSVRSIKQDAFGLPPQSGETPHAASAVHARAIPKDNRKDDGFKPFHFFEFEG